ncbi:MAG: hypothetical protein ACR2I1_00225 [Propionibacteriaceae bacterium]
MADPTRGPGPHEEPDAEIDRRFAELVSRFYDAEVGEERSHRPLAPRPFTAEPQGLTTDEPLFTAPPEPAEPVPQADDQPEAFEPAPAEPLPRLSTPALTGSLMLTSSIVICLLAVLGVRFPAWAGWLAITGFAIGLILLLSRLPHHRDPEDGDGAVL